MKIFEKVCGTPRRSSSMAVFERPTRKGNGNSDKLSMNMGAPKSNSNLSVRDKLQLAVRRVEVTEVPPAGLNINEAFIKEMFTLHVKSVDAIRDLQKKLEESNLMLALERMKCQEKEKRIHELNNNVTELETDLQQEQDSHERTKLSYQQLVKLQQQTVAAAKDQQEGTSHNQKQKQTSRNQNSKSANAGENTKASENKRTRGNSSTTKPRTYRRHRNSRGPPLLSPAITPDTPFRNAKPEKVLERAIDKEQSGDNCDEDEELPSDVEADSVKPKTIPKKIGVIEANCSTNLYNSYLNNKAPTTATAVLSALGKNYSYDPKVIGDISNAIHKTILNETLENENAKERARRSRRTNSGRRSRSTSSEGQIKTRRRRKSRGKPEKSTTKAPSKERLFDSGNTKQLLQTLEKICQNRTVKGKNGVNESVAVNGVIALNAPVNNASKQNSSISSTLQSNSVSDNSTNQTRSRGRRKKNDSEDKCNEAVSPPKVSTSAPVRTITTRNSVARGLVNSLSAPTTSVNHPNSSKGSLLGGSPLTQSSTPFLSKASAEMVSSTTVAPKVMLSPDIVSKPMVSSSQVSSSVMQEKKSVASLKLDFFSSENLPSSSGLTNNKSHSIASAVAAVSKINLPVSSTSAAIPKANSPGTSASAGLPKVDHPTPAVSNDAGFHKVTLLPDNALMKINNLTKTTSILAKTLSSVSKGEENENSASKENNPGASLLKTALSSNSTLSKMTSTDIAMTGPTTKCLISNGSKIVSIDPTKLKTSAPTGPYIERIHHGYTRNMNPLIKIHSKISPSASASATAASMKTSALVINMVPKKPIIYHRIVRPVQPEKKCETISKCDESVPPVPPTRYSSDVKLNQRENCMTTIYPYFVLDAPPLVSRKKEKRFVIPRAREGNARNVEVPRWRILEFDHEDDTSDIEDMDDNVFLKRHQRSEIDEKRRKRWDSQRMREENYLERLRRRMAMREKHPHPLKRNKMGKTIGLSDVAEESDEDMESFQPCIEDIRYIRIDENIPIGTFGYPMPIVQNGNFELPWSLTGISSRTSSTTTASTSSGSKPLCPNSYSPRRNGTVVTNGYGSPISNTIITPPPTPTLPNSIPSCSPAGPSVSSSSSSSKDLNVSNNANCPSASTRQSSKRL